MSGETISSTGYLIPQPFATRENKIISRFVGPALRYSRHKTPTRGSGMKSSSIRMVVVELPVAVHTLGIKPII
jgi:hypothetical protein